MKRERKLTLVLSVVVMLGICVSASPRDHQDRPFIRKLGTIDCDMVETTPVVFKGKVHRCEWVRKSYKGNELGENYFRLVDVSTGNSTLPFARGYVFASAFVDGDTIYVTGTSTEEDWTGRRVEIFASQDLQKWQNWTEHDSKHFRGKCGWSSSIVS